MLEHAHQYTVGHGGDMSPGLGGRYYVAGVAKAGSYDLGGQAIAFHYGHRVGHYFHAIVAYIVQAPDKGAYIRCPRYGGQEGLISREDQGHVDLNAFPG